MTPALPTQAVSSPAPVVEEALPDFESFKATEDAKEISAIKSPAASTPAKPASAAKPAETAAASATAPAGTSKAKSEAAIRLDELLADLKNAGLSPTELKTFKREAATAAAAEPAKAAPETTVQPQAPEKLVKPTMADRKADGTLKYGSWEEVQEARDEYFVKLGKQQAAEAVAADRQARAAEAQQNELKTKVAEAKVRYGEEATAAINTATQALNVKDMNPVIRAMCDDSRVLVDVMYVLGSKPADLAEFVELTKSNPGLAVRKFALIEHLVAEELAKGGTAAADKGAAAPGRDETGKFVAEAHTPAKPKRAAPAPPDELNTRGAAPVDAEDAAFREAESSGNARTFIDDENRRELAARRRGA